MHRARTIEHTRSVRVCWPLMHGACTPQPMTLPGACMHGLRQWSANGPQHGVTDHSNLMRRECFVVQWYGAVPGLAQHLHNRIESSNWDRLCVSSAGSIAISPGGWPTIRRWCEPPSATRPFS